MQYLNIDHFIHIIKSRKETLNGDTGIPKHPIAYLFVPHILESLSFKYFLLISKTIGQTERHYGKKTPNSSVILI